MHVLPYACFCHIHALPYTCAAIGMCCYMHVLPYACVAIYMCCHLHVLPFACIATCMCCHVHVLIAFCMCCTPPHHHGHAPVHSPPSILHVCLSLPPPPLNVSNKWPNIKCFSLFLCLFGKYYNEIYTKYTVKRTK